MNITREMNTGAQAICRCSPWCPTTEEGKLVPFRRQAHLATWTGPINRKAAEGRRQYREDGARRGRCRHVGQMLGIDQR